ncbi:MAG: Holliday junction resolvase RuvX [Selenomonadaceae bacterium]|nr:Holliday junction resolvase RuvX [Selenomonadaceae bacterium]
MRCLSLDVGDKTIGIAVSDPLGLTAQGVKTISRTSIKNDIKELGELIKEFEVDKLIIGLPKNMNGTEGERCEIVRKFAAKILAAYPEVEQIFWDERLSTVAAEKSLIAADVSRKKRKKIIDKMAAVYILQGYLDSVFTNDISEGENYNG